MIIKNHFGVGSIFRLRKFNKHGIIETIGPFHNTVTDVGLDWLATHDMGFLYYTAVGSGNTAPAVSDTTLGNQIAYQQVNLGGRDSLYCSGNNSIEDMYAKGSGTAEYSIGTFNGDTIREVGISDGDPDGAGTLFSRQLLLDAEGSPTELTIASDEGLYLDIELRLYPDLGKTGSEAGSFPFDGGSPDIEYTRTICYNSVSWTGDHHYNLLTAYSSRSRPIGALLPGVYGSASTITGSTTGTDPDSTTYSAYISGSLERTCEAVWNPGSAPTSVWQIIMRAFDSVYTFVLDQAIEVSDLEELTLNFKFTWGRYNTGSPGSP